MYNPITLKKPIKTAMESGPVVDLICKKFASEEKIKPDDVIIISIDKIEPSQESKIQDEYHIANFLMKVANKPQVSMHLLLKERDGEVITVLAARDIQFKHPHYIVYNDEPIKKRAYIYTLFDLITEAIIGNFHIHRGCGNLLINERDTHVLIEESGDGYIGPTPIKKPSLVTIREIKNYNRMMIVLEIQSDEILDFNPDLHILLVKHSYDHSIVDYIKNIVIKTISPNNPPVGLKLHPTLYDFKFA